MPSLAYKTKFRLFLISNLTTCFFHKVDSFTEKIWAISVRFLLWDFSVCLRKNKARIFKKNWKEKIALVKFKVNCFHRVDENKKTNRWNNDCKSHIHSFRKKFLWKKNFPWSKMCCRTNSSLKAVPQFAERLLPSSVQH